MCMSLPWYYVTTHVTTHLTFFFHSFGARCMLDSFPTRRSSDLCWRPPPPASRSPRSCAASHERGERSEEHTSELQSRVDLVCRLLLEKKKSKALSLIACCGHGAYC